MFGVGDGPEEDSPRCQEEQRSHGPATNPKSANTHTQAVEICLDREYKCELRPFGRQSRHYENGDKQWGRTAAATRKHEPQRAHARDAPTKVVELKGWMLAMPGCGAGGLWRTRRGFLYVRCVQEAKYRLAIAGWGAYIQDRELPGHCGQNEEQAETDDEAYQRGQVARSKDHQPIPSTHYYHRPRVSASFNLLHFHPPQARRQAAERHACDSNGHAGTLGVITARAVIMFRVQRHRERPLDSQAKKPSSSSRRLAAGNGAPGPSSVVGSLT